VANLARIWHALRGAKAFCKMFIDAAAARYQMASATSRSKRIDSGDISRAERGISGKLCGTRRRSGDQRAARLTNGAAVGWRSGVVAYRQAAIRLAMLRFSIYCGEALAWLASTALEKAGTVAPDTIFWRASFSRSLSRRCYRAALGACIGGRSSIVALA
jgi:hypothetical protein